MRIALLIALTVALQAAEPRATPDEYPWRGDAADAAIGFDYLVHSIPTKEGMIFARHYLVFDVGVFPHKGREATISAVNFHLIVNGKSEGTPDAPGMVAGSVKYSDWEPSRRLQGIAQAGPVVVGPQQRPGRFPGDPTGPRPLPQPSPDDGVPRAEPLSVDDLIAHARLPEGAFRKPVGGAICFHYEGKTKKIHSLELVWEPPGAPPLTLKLK